MNKFGTSSLKKLSLANDTIQKVMELAIQRSLVDITIVQTYRPPTVQFGYYQQGRQQSTSGWIITDKSKVITNVDGYKIVGKHNKQPAEAVDIRAYHSNPKIDKMIAYDKLHLAYIAGTIISCAEELFKKGEIKELIRWGGNWDKDGELYFDQKLEDLPHFETYLPKK